MLRETRPETRDRFLREARTAARVSHPHVCPIYEIDEDAGQLFIAMELLEGESLADRLRRGALPVAEAGAVALAILSALESLHAAGVVHRGLKPSNVYLTPNGVKLLDFGLARSTTPDETTITQDGTVVGTPRYMVPEQVEGKAPDARADLFALGALLYEMPSGWPAFAGLCHACRYAGLMHASIAAHARAQWLDPSLPTSVSFTWYFLGEYQRAIDERRCALRGRPVFKAPVRSSPPRRPSSPTRHARAL